MTFKDIEILLKQREYIIQSIKNHAIWEYSDLGLLEALEKTDNLIRDISKVIEGDE